MDILNLITRIPGLGGLTEKAPQVLSDFLDKLLKENEPLIDQSKGEVQIFYIMFPKPDTNEYIISIVTADGEDKILRSLKSIRLNDALSIIFNQQDNAKG